MSNKITNVVPSEGYEWNNKSYHTQMVTLDNGVTGIVSALSPDKWQVGQEVEIKKQSQDQKGNTKISLGLPDSGGFSGGGFSSNGTVTKKSYDDSDAQAGYVLSYAKDMLVAGKIKKEQVVEVANFFYDCKEEIKKHIKGTPAPQTATASSTNEDLPF